MCHRFLLLRNSDTGTTGAARVFALTLYPIRVYRLDLYCISRDSGLIATVTRSPFFSWCERVTQPEQDKMNARKRIDRENRDIGGIPSFFVE